MIQCVRNSGRHSGDGSFLLPNVWSHQLEGSNGEGWLNRSHVFGTLVLAIAQVPQFTFQ